MEIKKQLGDFRLETAFTADRETLAILGASGCGKSMTLKCVAGIVRPDEGRIVLDGQVLFDSAAHIDLPPQRRKVGYLFQQYALFPNMTVEQNILAALQSGSRRQRREQAAAFLRRFHLEDQADKLPAQLSGGQQQRTALARILASEPKAILLDEPFSAMDSHLKWELELELARTLADYQGPILWVSHDMGEVYRHCTRVVVLDHGKGQDAVPFDRLLRSPGTVSAARLAGCQNFVPCTVRDGGVFLPGWELFLPCAVPDRDADILGIPATALRPCADGPLPCQVVHAARDLDHTILSLRPLSAPPDSPLLRAELPKGDDHTPGQQLRFAVEAGQLLFLHDEHKE